MRQLKRVIAFIAMLAVSVACVGPVYAANGASAPQASITLSSYTVRLDPGDNKGELDISFEVTATGWADSVGVSYIEIHRASDGKLIDTVHSSTSSGLRRTSDYTYTNTYTYKGATSGVRYYAIVAVSAEIGDDYDSRTLTTRTVTAP